MLFIGCLLKRSTTVRERRRAAVRLYVDPLDVEYSHYGAFLQLPTDTRRFMNEKARAIWTLISYTQYFNLSVWFEYVKSKYNVISRSPEPLRRFTWRELSDSGT